MKWLWHRWLYRPTMKLLHRFNLCYMKPMPIIEQYEQQVWCQWCGVRYIHRNYPVIGK